MTDVYKKPYLDSSVFIAWVKNEIVEGVERGKIAEHILSLSEHGDFAIYTSTLTLAEVHKTRGRDGLPNSDDDKILEYLERTYIKLIDVDRRIGERANKLCREHGIRPNDAIHLACALRAGCDVLLAWDDRFAKVTMDGISVEAPTMVGHPTLPHTT